MFLSDDAITCLKLIDQRFKESNSNEFDPSAYGRKELHELEKRGLVTLKEQGIIEIGIYHPEALT